MEDLFVQHSFSTVCLLNSDSLCQVEISNTPLFVEELMCLSVFLKKKLPGLAEDTDFDSIETMEHVITVSRKTAAGPWKEDDEELKPCWSKPDLGTLLLAVHL